MKIFKYVAVILVACFLFANKCLAQIKNPDTTSPFIGEPMEIWPTYPGGNEKFQAFVINHVKVAPKIRGRIIAVFTVEKNGRLTGIRILRGLRPDVDSSVLRAIRKSPRWKPGIQGDQIVRMAYTMPFNFK